jgi:hypothetical protein
MAKVQIKTVPVTTSFLVEDVIKSTRTEPVLKQRWFMPEARAAVKQDLLIIQAEDRSRGLVI